MRCGRTADPSDRVETLGRDDNFENCPPSPSEASHVQQHNSHGDSWAGFDAGRHLSFGRARRRRFDCASLSPEEVERLRLEMAKAQLWEWNQLERSNSRAVMRYRRYLGSWLVMCLAAFSAYVSYPEYFICVFLSLLSIFLWWRAAFMERKAEREAQSLRNSFRPDWGYLQERLQESDEAPRG